MHDIPTSNLPYGCLNPIKFNKSLKFNKIELSGQYLAKYFKVYDMQPSQKMRLNNFNIWYWSSNYHGCWKQPCPSIDPHQSFQMNSIKLWSPNRVLYFFWSPTFQAGSELSCTFLNVVAVSHATCSEFSLDSQLIVINMAGTSHTINIWKGRYLKNN